MTLEGDGAGPRRETQADWRAAAGDARGLEDVVGGARGLEDVAGGARGLEAAAGALAGGRTAGLRHSSDHGGSPAVAPRVCGPGPPKPLA